MSLPVRAGFRKATKHRRTRWRFTAATRNFAKEATQHTRTATYAGAFARQLRQMRPAIVSAAKRRGFDPVETRKQITATAARADAIASQARADATAARKKAVSAAKSAASMEYHADRLVNALALEVDKLNPGKKRRGRAKEILEPWDFPE